MAMKSATYDTAAWRAAKTPKIILLSVLILLVAVTAPQAPGGTARAWLVVGVAAATAAATELAAVAVARRRLRFPDGALGTGMILGMILDPKLSLLIIAAVSAGSIVVKHAIRIRRRNALNPAAVGLVVLGLAGIKAQSWWGTSTAPGYVIIPLIVAGGLCAADRVNRLPMAGIFLAVYYALLGFAAFFGMVPQVAEAYHAPFVNTALFAAFIMLTDPPTSPGRRNGQYTYAVICAVVSATFIAAEHQLYFLPLGVLAGNVWFAWTRLSRRTASSGKPVMAGGHNR